MTPETLGLMLARLGVEFTIAFLRRVEKGDPITAADLEELRKYAPTRDQVIAEARAALGGLSTG